MVMGNELAGGFASLPLLHRRRRALMAGWPPVFTSQNMITRLRRNTMSISPPAAQYHLARSRLPVQKIQASAQSSVILPVRLA